MSINRWDPGYDHYADVLAADGDWVRYHDHATIDEAWRGLVRRAWQLLDVECPNDPITDELLAALEPTYRITEAGRKALRGEK